MSKPRIIAIDGPAASGKTTLARRLAQALGYAFFDTGVLYRAVTWAALQRGEDLRDEARMTLLARTLDVELRTTETGETLVWLQGRDATQELYSPQVDAWVSVVAAHPGVRQALKDVQRRLALQGHIVVVGRDIGTVIVPEADMKIYLDASLEERARRRYEEARRKGHSVTLEQVLKDMARRDALDASRATAPLRPAEDAYVLQTNGLSADEVFEKVMQWMRKKFPNSNKTPAPSATS